MDGRNSGFTREVVIRPFRCFSLFRETDTGDFSEKHSFSLLPIPFIALRQQTLAGMIFNVG